MKLKLDAGGVPAVKSENAIVTLATHCSTENERERERERER